MSPAQENVAGKLTTLNETSGSASDTSNIISALTEVTDVHALLAAARRQLGGNQIAQNFICGDTPWNWHNIRYPLPNAFLLFMAIQPIFDTYVPLSVPQDYFIPHMWPQIDDF